MTLHAPPFAIQAPHSDRLGAVHDYWRSLLRGGAEVPFADDVDVTRLEALCPDVLLIGVFEKPRRFRIDLARTPHAPQIEIDLVGRFLDEIDPPATLALLRAQADAAAETLAAAVYEHRPKSGHPCYGRLVLPAWGEGRVSLLLVALEFR
jgi:hypothetical protein